MIVWSYDGSLEGLLSLLRRSWDSGAAPDLVRDESRREQDLFSADKPGPGSAVEPALMPGYANDAAYLKERAPRLYAACLRAWMSEEPVEAALLRMAADCSRRGDLALGDWSRPDLAALAGSIKRVNHEIHRLCGMARFSRRKDGLYAAPLEPDHDIIPALLPHFIRRFAASGIAFALIDLKRSYAVLRDAGGLQRLWGAEALALLPDGEDEEDKALWKRYHRSIDNPARRNPRLQRKLMPVRYWKHLSELDPGA